MSRLPSSLVAGSPRLRQFSATAAARGAPLLRSIMRRVDLLGLLGVAIFLGIWYLLTFWVRPSLLPTPARTFNVIVDQFFYTRKFQYYGLQDHGYFSALIYTMQNIGIAMLIGCSIGILLGLVTARNSLTRAVFDPIALTLGTVPVVIAAPFLILWFGPGRAPAVGMVTFQVAVILYIYAQKAVTNLDQIYISAARTYGASRRSIILEILVPSTLPEILGGIRIALASCWGLAAIGELMGSQRGIGKLIESITTSSDIPSLFGALIVLGLAALVVDTLVAFLISSLFKWRNPHSAA